MSAEGPKKHQEKYLFCENLSKSRKSWRFKPGAQFNLGLCYDDGTGVENDMNFIFNKQPHQSVHKAEHEHEDRSVVTKVVGNGSDIAAT